MSLKFIRLLLSYFYFVRLPLYLSELPMHRDLSADLVRVTPISVKTSEDLAEGWAKASATLVLFETKGVPLGY